MRIRTFIFISLLLIVLEHAAAYENLAGKGENNFFFIETLIDTSGSITTSQPQKRFFNSFHEMPNYKGKRFYIAATILGSAGVFLNVANLITDKRGFKIVGYPAMLVGFVILIPAGVLEHKRMKSLRIASR